MASLQTLIDMGFPESKVQKAMEVCNNNAEQAMEWLLVHSEEGTTEAASDSQAVSTDKNEDKEASGASDKVAASDEAATSDGIAATDEAATSDGIAATDEVANPDESEEAKSIKCDECQKLFKTSEEVEFHAVKSGHSSFSESTEEKRPLTDEERKDKLRELETKIKQRRVEKEEEDRKETIEKEKKRIQQSREYAEMKKKQDEQEIKKLVEERRREKLEDKMARQRVKDQIERDRQARREKDLILSGAPLPPQAPPPQPQQSTTQSSTKKEYDSTRLQIRFPSGMPLVQNFNAKESLSAVRLWISLNRDDGVSPSEPFNLSTTFPRKIFTEDDMEKPLSLLGLVPSAVLAVTK